MNCSTCVVCEQAPAEWGDGTCGKRCHDVAYSRSRRQRVPNLHNERNPTYRGVIALDGEGFDGRYTLLAGSHGGYIEDYESPQGLSTNECLQWLLNLPDKPLKWGFAFTYDVNMILRDLERSDLERLQRTSRVFWYNYSIHHYPGKMFRIVERAPQWVEGPRKALRSVTVWDLYPFIQSSFVKFLQKFELASPEEIARIAGMKDQRSDFANVDRDLIRRYCIDECNYLERGATLFLELFEQMGYRTNAYYSPGTIAALEFRRREPHTYYKEPPSHIQTMVDRAYYGGRAEISRVGPVTGRFWQYDINSAYPYAATLLPCLAHGTWERSTQVHPHGVYQVKWSCPDGQVWGPFPWRPSTGSLKYPRAGVTYVWGIELLPWMDKISIDVIDGFVWHQTCQHRPFRYLAELYDERAELKRLGDNREYVVKLILNSTYGKLAQRRVGVNGKVSRWQSLAWAGLITATTRAMLAAHLAEQQENIIMVATDSILSRAPLQLPVSKNLGDWDSKELENLFVVGAGFLFAENGADKLIRTRGLRSTDVNYRALEEAWFAYGREGTYPATMNRFFGYGIALQRRDGFRLWRRFHTVELSKRFSQFPRRQWTTGNVWDGRTIAPSLTSCQGTELLDGLLDLQRDNLNPNDDQGLAALLISLASRHQLDDATGQPDWIIAEMGD